jgi:hypothetical protein
MSELEQAGLALTIVFWGSYVVVGFSYIVWEYVCSRGNNNNRKEYNG